MEETNLSHTTLLDDNYVKRVIEHEKELKIQKSSVIVLVLTLL